MLTVSYNDTTKDVTVTVAATGEGDPVITYKTVENRTLTNISAQYTATSEFVVHHNDSLDVLKPYISVTATYAKTVKTVKVTTLNGESTEEVISSETTEEIESNVTGYGLSGELKAGKVCKITVTYGDKSTVIDVTVSDVEAALATTIEAKLKDESTEIYGNLLTDYEAIKELITVNAWFNDGTTRELEAGEYSVEQYRSENQNKQMVYKVTYINADHTLAIAYVTINVKTSVEPQPEEIIKLEVEFAQDAEDSNVVIYTSNKLSDLRGYLTVRAITNFGNSNVIMGYNLSGELVAGTPVITVTYGGKSATFTVKVTAVALKEITVNFIKTTQVYTTTALDSLKSMLTVTAKYNDGSSTQIAETHNTL